MNDRLRMAKSVIYVDRRHIRGSLRGTQHRQTASDLFHRTKSDQITTLKASGGRDVGFTVSADWQLKFAKLHFAFFLFLFFLFIFQVLC